MKIKIFKNNQFGNIRVLRDERGEPWFVAKDVAIILGYANPQKAIRDHVDDEDKRGERIVTPSGTQEAIVINESGLYSLILKSNKPEAKKFKRWVTAEVLPSIRKHGIYATDEVIEKTLKNPDFLIEILTELKKEREERQKLSTKVNILTHTKKTYTTTEIAKELGFKSAIELNKRLEELGIQYKVNNTWVLSAKYADKGYTQTKQSLKADGQPLYYTRWTQKGREFLLELFSNANLENKVS
jgi:prophage antirepressor-like protein